MKRLLVLLALALVAAVGAAPVASAQSDDWWNVPVDPDDAAIPLGLHAYHEIAPKLHAIDEASDRVTVEVSGESADGRDLYRVIIADPDSADAIARWEEYRTLSTTDPEAARELVTSGEVVAAPVFINSSIHGNEWEGVDASLDTIERLAFSDDPEVARILEQTFIIINAVANPDGRVAGRRQNGNGFDLNRDFATLSQPETLPVVEDITRYNPVVLLDLHGYVNPYLISPNSAPHAAAYDYAFYLPLGFANAQNMEAALVAGLAERGDSVPAGVNTTRARIPFRDDSPGAWDDYPPIYTPMYAMLHGGLGYTLETFQRPNSGSDPQLWRARAANNRAGHRDTIWASLEFVAEHRVELLENQIAYFERSLANAPAEPLPPDFVPGWSGTGVDQPLADFPAGYVIPVGEGQASDLAAARLVNLLLAHDVDVDVARRDFTLGGRRYEAGSYVVDLRQAKRNVAYATLDDGDDISALAPRMYDISAWSQGRLWGATVVEVPRGTPLPRHVGPARGDQTPRGEVVGRGKAAAYAFTIDDPVTIQTVNRLLADGVAVARAGDGRVVVSGLSRGQALRLSHDTGITLEALPAVPADAEPLRRLRVGHVGAENERYTLSDLGFDVTPLTAGLLNEGFDLASLDALVVSSTFNVSTLQPEARARLDAWLADGGAIVGRGAGGIGLNEALGLLPVAAASGPSNANGIVEVDNTGSEVLAGAPAQDSTFVYGGPRWFPEVGDGVVVEQRLAEGDFFVAGHWSGDRSPAAGQPIVVRGEADGARVVLFGSDPLFRDHPKGLFRQIAHALWWATGS